MKKTSVGAVIIASAIVWGLVIVGCSYKLKGTGGYEEISTILFAGMIAHLILIWAPMLSKPKKKE